MAFGGSVTGDRCGHVGDPFYVRQVWRDGSVAQTLRGAGGEQVAAPAHAAVLSRSRDGATTVSMSPVRTS